MPKSFLLSRYFILLFATLSLFLAGCGESADDIALDLTPDEGRVPHQSWGSYRLYTYTADGWRPVINLGDEVLDLPALGDRPVVILHGLGSRIDTGKFNSLASSLVANGATSVFGFEYDSLDPIPTNASHFANALKFLTRTEKNKVMRVVGHSMGALVARSAFEGGATFEVAQVGNIVSLVAGPQLGSEVAKELQESDPALVERALQDAVLDGQLDFRNADGTPVKVTGDEPSFAQLVPNSNFLNSLNTNVSHDQWAYRSLAGTDRGDELQALNQVLGVFADDGIVNVGSANAAVSNPLRTDTVPFDHVRITEAQPSIAVILEQLGLPPAQ